MAVCMCMSSELSAIHQQMLSRFGEPRASHHDDQCYGHFWLVGGRVCVLCGGGKVGTLGTDWTIQTHEKIRADWAQKGRGIYILWDFEKLQGYETYARKGVSEWLKEHRKTINRAVIYTANPLVRMGVNTVNMLFGNYASAPGSVEQFFSSMDDYLDFLNARDG